MTLRNAKRTQTLPLIGCNLIKITEISILVKSRGIAMFWRIPLACRFHPDAIGLFHLEMDNHCKFGIAGIY